MPLDPVHVIGATGRSGIALCRSLLADAVPIVPVVRNMAKWHAAGLGSEARYADLQRFEPLAAALQGAVRVVSCAHARHTAAVLAAAPPNATCILLGSTRKFTRWPDAHGNGVLAGEAALIRSGRRGAMLHPTMIYGAEGENNVQRLAALLRRLPVLPLPGGGRFLVQPIFQDDVTRAVRAALQRDWPAPRSLVIAGPDAVHYADFMRMVAAAAGCREPPILPFPVAPLMAAALLTRALPVLPRIAPAEIRRLTEDKAFAIRDMRRLLGIEPTPLAAGLALTFKEQKAA